MSAISLSPLQLLEVTIHTRRVLCQLFAMPMQANAEREVSPAAFAPPAAHAAMVYRLMVSRKASSRQFRFGIVKGSQALDSNR
jgi:hypothetical protein